MNHEFIMSSCHGVVIEISIEPQARIYEWEKLFTIKTDNGELETVKVGISGKVESLEVQVGDRVIPGMVLAFVKEDLFANATE